MRIRGDASRRLRRLSAVPFLRLFVGACQLPILLPLLVAFLLLLPVQTVFAEGEQPAPISGQVLSDVGGSPVSGATVTVLDSVGTAIAATTTAADGTYRFDTLPGGTYRLSFAASGYHTEFYNNAATLAAAQSLTLSAGETRSGVDARLLSTDYLSGLVTDAATGLPLANIRVWDIYVVQVWSYTWVSDGPFGQGHYERTFSFEQSTDGQTTGADGRYCVRTGDGSLGTPITLHADDQRTPRDYFPVTLSLTVSTLNGVQDIALDRTGQSLSGHVLSDLDGSPVGGATVTALDSEGTAVAATAAAADGTYRFDTLPAGTYRLSFAAAGYHPEYYNNAATLAAAQFLPLSAGQTRSGVDARLLPVSHLSGLVTDAATGLPLANIRVWHTYSGLVPHIRWVDDGSGVVHAEVEYITEQVTEEQTTGADGRYRVSTGGQSSITLHADDQRTPRDYLPVTLSLTVSALNGVQDIALTSVNHPPVVATIPDQTIDEGGIFATIDLNDYVADVDDTDAGLTWTTSGATALIVGIDPVTHVATITIPGVDWNGAETVTFRATDPGLLHDERAATFTVTPVNDTPVAAPVALSTAEDTAAPVTLVATDVDGDSLTYSMLAPPTHGSLSSVSGSTVTYTPALNYHGPDAFTYTANDGTLDSAPATVTLTVTPVNDTPVLAAIPGQTIDEGGIFATIDLDDYASDVDDTDAGLTWTTSGATALTVGIDPITHVATITIPGVDWNGAEIITFRATDPGLLHDERAATFTVTPVNDTPVAAPVALSTAEDTAAPVTLVATDVDGDSLTYSMLAPPTHGSLSSVSGSTVTYTPALNYHGPDAFTYTANDGTLDSAPATVTLTVTPVNDTPVLAAIPGQTIDEGGIFATIDLDDYASDVDDTDAGLTWTTSGATALTVGIDPITHVATVTIPGADWNGAETITFRATDPGLLHDERAATFTVKAVSTSYTIAASVSGGHGSISPNGQVKVTKGSDQTFTIVPASGYHVADVLVDGVSKGAATTYTFSNVTAGHTIVATFSSNSISFIIKASAGPGGSISPSNNVNVRYGTNRTFTITPASGYHVADVLVDGVSKGAVTTYTFSNVTAGHTIVASFAVNARYTIVATAGLGGSISPSGQVAVVQGSSKTFIITPASGYHVADVLVDGVSKGAVTTYTFSNVTAGHTIAASFARTEYVWGGFLSPLRAGDNRRFSLGGTIPFRFQLLHPGVSRVSDAEANLTITGPNGFRKTITDAFGYNWSGDYYQCNVGTQRSWAAGTYILTVELGAATYSVDVRLNR